MPEPVRTMARAGGALLALRRGLRANTPSPGDGRIQSFSHREVGSWPGVRVTGNPVGVGDGESMALQGELEWCRRRR